MPIKFKKTTAIFRNEVSVEEALCLEVAVLGIGGTSGFLPNPFIELG